jgi:hypothetical protein
MSHDLRQQRRPARTARRVSPVKATVAVVVPVAAVVALFAAGIAAEQFSHGLPDIATATAGKPVVKAGPDFGEAVRDGQFEFTVTRVDCSRATIALERLERTANGKLCVIGLTVRNIGDDPKYFVGRAQTAYDTAGAAYDSDELAGLYANRGVDAFLQKVGPGEKVSGKLVFDLPKKADPAGIELHDSPLSGGVKAPLRPVRGG